MHVAQRKQNVHHLKKNDKEKGFAICELFLCDRNLFKVIWLTDRKGRLYNETYV